MPSLKKNQKQTIAITGANGFVGSHVVKYLLENTKFFIRACVRDPTNKSKIGHLENLTGGSDRIKFYASSLDKEGSYDEAFEGADAVIHTAARVHESWSDALLESHIQGTTNVVSAAKKSSTVQRFVQTSSIAAIIDPYHEKANNPSFVFDESNYNSTTDPKTNGDYYGYAKCVAEKIAVEAGNDEATNFDTVVINPSVVIGECLCKAHTKASPVFIRQMLYGNEQPLIYFSWVDAEDVAKAHHDVLFKNNVSGERFIITNEFEGTVVDVASTFKNAHKALNNVRSTPTWKIYLQYLFMTDYEWKMLNSKLPVTNKKAKSILGFESFISMEESLKKTINSMIEKKYIKLK
jgi:nucleoside-diphosphate-sugar epimerase